MDLIKILKEKFNLISIKLSSNIQIINNNYSKDFDYINCTFNSYKKELYENGLNEQREQMLKQLKQNRDEILKKIEFFCGFHSFVELKAFSESIKCNYEWFACSLISIYESILFRSKFRNQLNLGKLVKYSIFMTNEKCFRLTNDICYKNYLNILPNNQIFLLFNDNKENDHMEFFMGIFNFKNGNLVHHRRINNQLDNSIRDFDFKANATNIFSFNRFNSLIEIYNFKFELVYSFRLELQKYSGFKLYDYDICLFDCVKSLITCYNYKTVKLFKRKNSYLDKNMFLQLYNSTMDADVKEFFYLDLLGLNDEFLFIVGYVEQEQCALFILNRNDDNKLFRFIRSDSDWFMYNTEICYFKGCFDSDKIYAYDMSMSRDTYEDSFFILNYDYEQYKFDDIYLTSNRNYIYSRYMTKNENKTILKFRVY